MSSLLAMCDSMRLSATGRWTSESAATARWTCAMPPIPSCSYTMYGPNRSVGEPSLTRRMVSGFDRVDWGKLPLPVGSPAGPPGASIDGSIDDAGRRYDRAADQQQRTGRHHELDRRRQELDAGPEAQVVAQGCEHRDRRAERDHPGEHRVDR